MVALVSSLSLALAGLVGLGLAPAASAAPPDQCPANTDTVTWTLVHGKCLGKATAPSELAMTTWSCPDGYTTSDDPVTEESTCSMQKPVEPISVYQCPAGYSPSGDVSEGTTCTKVGEWKFSLMKWEWTCVVHGAYPDSVDVDHLFPPKPTEPCVDTVQAQFKSWTCPTVGTTCDDPVKPKCFETVYADPVPTYTYRCPSGYWPTRVDTDSTERPDFPVGEDTICMRILKEMPTCPAGQILEEIQLPDNNADMARHHSTRPLLNCVVPDEPIPTPATFGREGGAAQFCLATGPVVVSWDGVSGYGTQLDADVAATNVKADALAAAGVPAGTAEGACPAAAAVAPEVVAPVEVVAPAPATVAAPEAATVAAPAPGAVSAGVAGTAAVADTATVPAAIPAGDGSQAPTVPIWALAMIIVGVLGTAVAGRKLVTTK